MHSQLTALEGIPRLTGRRGDLPARPLTRTELLGRHVLTPGVLSVSRGTVELLRVSAH